MVDRFWANNAGNSEVSMVKIKKFCAERGILDMEESMIDLDYVIVLSSYEDAEHNTFWKNLEKVDESVEFPPSSLVVCYEGIPEEMSKTAEEFSKIVDEGGKGELLNTEGKSVDDENRVKGKVSNNYVQCKSNGKHSKKTGSVDEDYDYFLKSLLNYGGEIDQKDDSYDVEIIDQKVDNNYVQCKSNGKHSKKTGSVDEDYDYFLKSSINYGGEIDQKDDSSDVEIIDQKVDNNYVQCKSNGKHSKKTGSVDEDYDYFLKSWLNYGGEIDQKDDSSDVEILDMENLPFHEDSVPCESTGKCSKKMDYLDASYANCGETMLSNGETNHRGESSDVEILEMENIPFHDGESTKKCSKKMDYTDASYESEAKCDEKMLSSSVSSDVEILHTENILTSQAKCGEQLVLKCKTDHRDDVEVEILDMENNSFREGESTEECSKKVDYIAASYESRAKCGEKMVSSSESSDVEILHTENILSSRAKCAEKMVLKCETDHRDDVEVEILDMENNSFPGGGYTPFTPSKCYQSLSGDGSWEGTKDSNQSGFREKLTGLLKLPYDQKELESLWRKVTYKKPVQGYVNLRGGWKQYSTNIDGNSYLDWYEDLRKKIDEFNHEEHKILHLLRGFFFWLKNTPHGGTFKPWLDSSYLKALELECSRNSLN